MKYFCALLILLTTGCLQMKTKKTQPVLIEINSVPHPFDLAGNNPYVVWMNGKRVKLPKQDLSELVSKVGEENIPEIDSSDIHKGWLFPHFLEKDE